LSSISTSFEPEPDVDTAVVFVFDFDEPEPYAPAPPPLPDEAVVFDDELLLLLDPHAASASTPMDRRAVIVFMPQG
jgi:hypothetical protein